MVCGLRGVPIAIGGWGSGGYGVRGGDAYRVAARTALGVALAVGALLRSARSSIRRVAGAGIAAGRRWRRSR